GFHAAGKPVGAKHRHEAGPLSARYDSAQTQDPAVQADRRIRLFIVLNVVTGIAFQQFQDRIVAVRLDNQDLLGDTESLREGEHWLVHVMENTPKISPVKAVVGIRKLIRVTD